MNGIYDLKFYKNDLELLLRACKTQRSRTKTLYNYNHAPRYEFDLVDYNNLISRLEKILKYGEEIE